MRVLLISNFNVINGRGPMFRIMNMLPYLKRYCEVELCSLGPIDEPIQLIANKNNVKYRIINYVTKGWFVQNCNEIIDEITNITFKDNIDLIVLTWEIWDIAVLLQKNKNKYKAKLAIIMHSIPFVAASIKTGNYYFDYIKRFFTEPRYMIKKYLLFRLFQVNKYIHAFNIITMTHTVENKLNKYFNNLSLFTAYPGYAIENISEYCNNEYKYDFAYMAKFEYGKGIFEIIKIMQLIKRKYFNFKLALIGDFTFKDEERRFMKEINKKQLNNNIVIFGWIDGNEKYQILRQSKVFLYPSFIGDTFSICFLEALSCGKNIVCYDVPFVRDNFILSSVYSIPIFKHKEFAKMALNILHRKKYTSIESIDFVKNNYFSWDKVANAEFHAYKMIVRNVPNE
jgi:glycosyltransferase involved in cell wall biosynthesis